MYTKRKFAKQGASRAVVDSNSGEVSKQNRVKLISESVRCSQVEKMPLFKKVEMNKCMKG